MEKTKNKRPSKPVNPENGRSCPLDVTGMRHLEDCAARREPEVVRHPVDILLDGW